ncbi:MAG: VOC family protein [Pseudomonadota bacterium]
MAVLGRLVLYVRDIDAVAAWYALHFSMAPRRVPGDRITELRGPGAAILLHPLARGRKAGQRLVKVVFDVQDVATFVAASAADFGPVHKGDGYAFANVLDPAGNPVQVSSRAYVPDVKEGD